MSAVMEHPPAPTTPPPAAPPRQSLPRLRLRLPAAPAQRSMRAGFALWVGLIAAGLVAWTVVYAFGVSALQERHDQSVLYSKLREELSAATAPLGGVIEPGSPVALISMPSAGLRDVVVVEGTAAGDLTAGPGHRRDTPLPGQAGASLIFGRSTFFGGPFGDIPSAHPGDRITVVTGQGVAHYLVRDVRRAGDPYPPPVAAGKGRLILATAAGSGWRSGWASNGAVYVDADLQGSTFPTPSGRPSAVPKSEQPMQGDPAALYSLVFWLPLLGFAGAAVLWVRQRWGAWQTWVVGAPVVLALTWAVTQDVVRLLPNLL